MTPIGFRQARQQAQAARVRLESRQAALRVQVTRLPVPAGVVVAGGLTLGLLAGRVRALRAWALGRQLWGLWRGFSGATPRQGSS